MSALRTIGVAAFLVAGGLALLAERLGDPRMFRVALAAIGLLALARGVAAIRTGTIRSGPYGNYRERLTGASARWMGVFMILGGALVAVLAAIDLRSGGSASTLVADVVTGSPRGVATALALAGALVAVFGVTRVLSGSARERGPFARHVEFGFRAAGVASIVAGAAMLAVAAGLVVAPDRLSALLSGAVRAAATALAAP